MKHWNRLPTENSSFLSLKISRRTGVSIADPYIRDINDYDDKCVFSNFYLILV